MDASECRLMELAPLTTEANHDVIRKTPCACNLMQGILAYTHKVSNYSPITACLSSGGVFGSARHAIVTNLSDRRRFSKAERRRMLHYTLGCCVICAYARCVVWADGAWAARQ